MSQSKLLFLFFLSASFSGAFAMPKDPFDEYNEDAAARGVQINPRDHLNCALSGEMVTEYETTCVEQPTLYSRANPPTGTFQWIEDAGGPGEDFPLILGNNGEAKDGILLQATGKKRKMLVKTTYYVDVSNMPNRTSEDDARLLEEERQRVLADLQKQSLESGTIQMEFRESLKAADRKKYKDDRMIRMLRELQKPCADRNHDFIYWAEKKFNLGQQDKTCDPKGYWGAPTAPWLNQQSSTNQRSGESMAFTGKMKLVRCGLYITASEEVSAPVVPAICLKLKERVEMFKKYEQDEITINQLFGLREQLQELKCDKFFEIP